MEVLDIPTTKLEFTAVVEEHLYPSVAVAATTIIFSQVKFCNSAPDINLEQAFYSSFADIIATKIVATILYQLSMEEDSIRYR